MQELNKDEHHEQGQQQQGSEKGSDVDIAMKEKEELLLKQEEKINALQVIIELGSPVLETQSAVCCSLMKQHPPSKSAHTLLLAHKLYSTNWLVSPISTITQLTHMHTSTLVSCPDPTQLMGGEGSGVTSPNP